MQVTSRLTRTSPSSPLKSINVCAHLRVGMAHVPEQNGAVPSAAHKGLLVKRMPRDAGDLALVTLERAHLLHHAQIEQLHELIARRA